MKKLPQSFFRLGFVKLSLFKNLQEMPHQGKKNCQDYN